MMAQPKSACFIDGFQSPHQSSRNTPARQARRLKELEKQNGRLKRLVADPSLERQVLKDIASENLQAPNGAGWTGASRVTMLTPF